MGGVQARGGVWLGRAGRLRTLLAVSVLCYESCSLAPENVCLFVCPVSIFAAVLSMCTHFTAKYTQKTHFTQIYVQEMFKFMENMLFYGFDGAYGARAA